MLATGFVDVRDAPREPLGHAEAGGREPARAPFRMSTDPGAPSAVLESCLYAGDLEAAERFYTEVIGLEPFAREPGRHVFFRVGASAVFLVFDPLRTADPDAMSSIGGVAIPLHGARGAGHVAFAVREAALDDWRERFAAAGVALEAEVHWPSGGRSLYVRDPAGNSVELATPRLWGLPEPTGETGTPSER